MLKWTAYGKKSQDQEPVKELTEVPEENELLQRTSRHSLDGNTVKKNRKPNRYQRRSFGGTTHKKNHLIELDKENVNYIGNTPNYFKEGLTIKKTDVKTAFKDVSNVTPTTPISKSAQKHDEFKASGEIDNESRRSFERYPSNLPPTPPTYSRRIREAKKRKLEMTRKCSEILEYSPDIQFKLEEDINKKEVEKLKDCSLRESYHENKEILHNNILPNDQGDLVKKSDLIRRNITTIAPTVEIEYSPNTLVNNQDIILHNRHQSTLPIFGSKMFMSNPLYFSNNAHLSLKENKRKRRNDFESSFKSPSNDDKEVHEMISTTLSPVSMTPLSRRLSALRFSNMRGLYRDKLKTRNDSDSDSCQAAINPLAISLVRDDEISGEMETKYILSGNVTKTESTISDSQIGDKTLEKMIEDIIKSTKKVKNKRNVIKLEQETVLSLKEQTFQVEDLKTPNNELFIKTLGRNYNIKEAKRVSLSRENSISPRSSPVKTKKTINTLTTLNALNKSFILNDGEHEREVKTPENRLTDNPDTISELIDISALEKLPGYRLRRQRCVRRKKSTVSNESMKSKLKESSLTLDKGIPSPKSLLSNSCQKYDLLSSSFDCVVGMPIQDMDKPSKQFGTSPNKSTSSPKSIISTDSKANDKRNSSKSMFGLTLDGGIPSPITPVSNLKRPRSIISADDYSFKSSKLRLDEEYMMKNDIFTPNLENNFRRCFHYSPEEGSLNSNIEKRSSVASNRSDKTNINSIKGTIELKIACNDDDLDVHIIRCRELQRFGIKSDEINAYAKAAISAEGEATSPQSLGTHRAVFQRTSVLYGKREPEFQRHLYLPLPNKITEEHNVHISVWHRDKKYRRSEFLGCVSFPLKDAIKGDISGCFYLKSQVYSGRNIESKTPQTKTPHASFKAERDASDRRYRVLSVTEGILEEMATETDNVDGASQNNDDGTKENVDKGGPENRVAILQREADDHLFLRYLELDPEPEVSTPRKPSQTKGGRTPFTTSKKLTRTAAGGFGFTVIWTRPPRVERITPGGPAERAGMKPGDYLVFVSGKNVVMSSERDVRELVKSAGQTLVLEVFRRSAQNGVLSSSRQRLSSASHATNSECAGSIPRGLNAGSGLLTTGSGHLNSGSGLLGTEPPSAQSLRPGTACSGATTTMSLDAGASRRRLHLPQVTFSKEEIPNLSAEQQQRKALLAVVVREQNYVTCLQFGMVRFVTPLADKPELITPSDHQLLFQNIEEILRLSEDILDQVVGEDGEIQTSTLISVYLQKTPTFLNLYRRYCTGLKRADCVLVKKSRDSSCAFNRFCTTPPIPRRRPDITSLIHKPLEQFRELLRLMRAANGDIAQDSIERRQLQAIVDQLQAGYQEITAGSGMMGLAGDGKPLLSVQDLESRLVFTRCKPFVLNSPGRQWIFGGELSKVEGRTAKPYWALLFSDLLLFATVSRDRVLFITEEPVLLANVAEASYTVRKKVTEFHLIMGRNGGASPLVSCAPRALGRRTRLALRAPSIDLKAVWQSLLQRQIYRAQTMSGTPLGSPMDSPMDPAAVFSLAILDTQRRQANRRESTEASIVEVGSRGRSSSRGSALHLAHWMKQMPVNEEIEPPDTTDETWSVEELRKRSQELHLLDVAGIATGTGSSAKSISPNEKSVENDKSPSKSSNSGSQITVRTSPVVLDKIPVCRQCHKKCLSKPNSPLASQKEQNSISMSITDSLSPRPKSNQNKDCISNSVNSLKKSPGFSDLKKSVSRLFDIKDAPQAALKVIDSIEQNQKRLNKSYGFNEDSPLLNRKFQRQNSPMTLERQLEYTNKSGSASSSSRNSPLSTSHTTCSSRVLNSSGTDVRNSPAHKNPDSVQYVIAQEKFLSEVKHVESFFLPKSSTGSLGRDASARMKAETVLSKVFGVNIVTKTENVSGCLRTSSINLESDNFQNGKRNSPNKQNKFSFNRYNNSRTRANFLDDFENDEEKLSQDDITADDDLLMLMGFSAINPAAHLVKIDPFRTKLEIAPRPATLRSEHLPNISVIPPTPDYRLTPRNSEDLADESPDSPQPEDLPYISLKRYGTMSSLERMPSDETDDGNVKIAPMNEKAARIFGADGTDSADYIGGGIMSWTARAGSFVAEKMSLFNSYSDHTSSSNFPKQPSFLERYLGVGDWKSELKDDGVGGGSIEGGEGSGASGEEAWGTPSSGDLSDNAFSDHGTLSSPTKSSSSYAGDDDTELMMDELLMAPTITGPSLRPLLPRRRLEPLMEEEFSDSDAGSEDKDPVINPNQGSESGLVAGPEAADDCFTARQPTSVLVSGAESIRGTAVSSPDRTPTNETPSQHLLQVCESSPRARVAGETRRGSASSTTSSATSTLEQTAIHTTPPASATSSAAKDNGSEEERLSPRAEMRLALDQGKDMLAGQDDNWAGNGGPWSWRTACQRSLLRRVASADAVALYPSRDSTSSNSVYAWRESDKTSEMERLAQVEVQRMHSRRQTICQPNGKILGFIKRRASSASPERRSLSNQRPFSPRKQNVSSKQGYYKICFVNGSL